MKRKDIHDILHPRSIAVVGASNDFSRGATMFLHALLKIGYEGKIYPIHPEVDVSLGLKTYPSLLDVPDSVDHVIVGIPAHACPKVLDDAVKIGVRSVHFFTSGFAEVGTEEGDALQERINEIARGKVRIIGPNCMGIYNTRMKIAFDEKQSAIYGGADIQATLDQLAAEWDEITERIGVDSQREAYLKWAELPNAYHR